MSPIPILIHDDSRVTITWPWRLGFLGFGCCLSIGFVVRDLRPEDDIWNLVPKTLLFLGPYLFLCVTTLLTRKVSYQVIVAAGLMTLPGFVMLIYAPYRGIEFVTAILFLSLQFVLALIGSAYVGLSLWRRSRHL